MSAADGTFRLSSLSPGQAQLSAVHPKFAALYEEHFPRWWHDPEMLVRGDQLADEAVWSAHRAAKAACAAKPAGAAGIR